MTTLLWRYVTTALHYCPLGRTTFSKADCSAVLREEGLPVVRSILVESAKAVTEETIRGAGRLLGFPLVVKPNRGSGSLGVGAEIIICIYAGEKC